MHMHALALEPLTDSDGALTPAYGIGLVVLLAALALTAFVFVIAAMVSVLADRRLPGVTKIVWLLAVVAFPLIGSGLWFLFGRSARESRAVRVD